MRKYHDDDHANNRLGRCFIMHKVGQEWRCGRIHRATNRKLVITDGTEYNMNDIENTSFLFPRLGYYNSRHQACYVTRSAKRMWKTGLVPENIVQNWMYPHLVKEREAMTKHEVFLKQMFLNVYPSFDKCLKEIQDGRCAAKAFSRDFCLGLHDKTVDVVLYYRNFPIGHWDKDNKAIIIGDVNSHYIQKFLEVVDNKVKVLV